MNGRTVAVASAPAGLLERVALLVPIALLVVGCGGGAKSPGTCPDGTVLKGSDCVPDGSGDDSSKGGGSASSGKDDGDDTSSGSGAGSTASGGSSGGGGGGGGGDTAPAGSGTPYDKEAVDVQLKRAARQVKAHCGTATDEEGKASGPWGQTKASVILGRNGHVKQVTVPAPYDGKPVGICIVHAFTKIVFPPYAAPSDSVLDWDVELVQPK